MCPSIQLRWTGLATAVAVMRGSRSALKSHISRQRTTIPSRSPAVARRVSIAQLYSGAMKAATIWIGAGAVVSGVLAFLYPDSYQQDGGYHFLFARWSWVHPDLMIGVWSRPAFTALYSIPAQLGYPAAKLFTVLLCGMCAWHAWRLAVDLDLGRSALAVPLLFLQPCFLLLSSETMTEPLFALILVVALRFQFGGRRIAAMLVASTLALARPEGFVLIAAWSAWILLDRRDP